MVSLAGDPVTIDAPYMFEDSGITKSETNIIIVTVQTGQTSPDVMKMYRQQISP